MMQNTPRSPIQSIDRAVAVLNTFLNGRSELALSEIAERTGLTRSTTHRLLSSLAVHGLVEQRAAGASYSLGAHVFRLARAAASAKDLVERARPLMNALRDEIGETIGLHVRKGYHARIVVAQAESPHQLRRTYTEIGEEIPIHLGAPGKLLLAYLPDELQDEVLREPLVQATQRTITDPVALRRELNRIRRQGYSLSLQERNPGVCTAAVPVHGGDGHVTAALGVTGPAVRLSKQRLLEVVPLLQDAAGELSAQLGDRASASGTAG